VPYLVVLQKLLEAVAGAQAALLLDAQGEVVVEAGVRDDRHRLIAAYHGIALATVQRTTDRYPVGRLDLVVCRYAWGSVILRPLKDGYYLILSLLPAASLAAGVHHSARAQQSLNAEI
jgi:predicted regulator of Ras-like GTPase activity (Roadblock/LC7/MglB family)